MARPAILQDYGNIQNPPSDNSYQLEVMRNMQRDKELNAQMGQRKQEKKDKEAYDLIGGIKLDHIGDNTIDLFTDKQLQGVKDKLMDMHLNNASTTDLMLYAQRELPKISNGHTIAKNEYSKLTEGIKELSKDNPTGDMSAVRNIGGKELLNTVLDFNEDGTVKGYKDASLIPKDKNYLQNLETNENLPKWYKESGAFEKGIKDLPLIKVGGKTSYTDKYGRKTKKVFSGHGSVFDEPIMNDEGEQTGWRLKSEAIPLGRNPDGSLIIEQVMPKEQFDLALPNDKAKKDFALRFNKQLEESGTNPDKIDPRARDVLERKYAYDFFSKTGIHGSEFLTEDEKKDAQIKSTTNITNKYGNDVKTMDIVTPVKDYIKEHEGNVVTYDSKDGTRKTIGGVAQLNVFNNEITSPIIAEVKSRYPNTTGDSIYYQTIGDDTWVMKTEDAGKINPEKDIVVFKLDDYSNIVGNKPQGQKAKNKSLAEAQNKMESKQGITYSWNGYDYSEDEINQAAAAEKLSKDAYLKKHGIKKK